MPFVLRFIMSTVHLFQTAGQFVPFISFIPLGSSGHFVSASLPNPPSFFNPHPTFFFYSNIYIYIYIFIKKKRILQVLVVSGFLPILYGCRVLLENCRLLSTFLLINPIIYQGSEAGFAVASRFQDSFIRRGLIIGINRQDSSQMMLILRDWASFTFVWDSSRDSRGGHSSNSLRFCRDSSLTWAILFAAEIPLHETHTITHTHTQKEDGSEEHKDRSR